MFHCRQHNGQLLFEVQQTGHILFLYQFLHGSTESRQCRQICKFALAPVIRHVISHAEPFNFVCRRGGVQQICGNFAVLC